VAFKVISAGGVSLATCTCENCGYQTEPLQVEKDWANQMMDRIREMLRARGWEIRDGHAWCSVCWKGMERVLDEHRQKQAS